MTEYEYLLGNLHLTNRVGYSAPAAAPLHVGARTRPAGSLKLLDCARALSNRLSLGIVPDRGWSSLARNVMPLATCSG